MEPFVPDREWIMERLPRDLPLEVVSRCLDMGRCWLDGQDIVVEGDRGGRSVVYTGSGKEDIRLWVFDRVCGRIGFAMELRRRASNTPKWRYSRDHAENGLWMYAERGGYTYNTIEDERLDAFEIYLRLIRPVFSPEEWEKRVRDRVGKMNRWYDRKHWDYDRTGMCFVEISDSQPYRSDSCHLPELTPGTIIKPE